MSVVATEMPSTSGLGYSHSNAPEQVASSIRQDDQLEIRIEFGGGLHLLFSQKPKYTIHIPRTIPSTSQHTNVKYLIQWMKENILSEREEMFIDGDTVRPGILVLINDADWELEGELDYELQNRDEVVFISTLHGG
ncbi:hypothetical protein BCR39DRAFT_541344 [Naematelia encephala]|uniref:Ubiquitin-related modifier 1 n=1 Tax=Naematelia encephala TaxID=71784 RepID=A0A1Y2AUV7_9TREE|nr:hypothetical protein BCR39DRAFT_541344 [Naematelia encephala]